MLSRLEELIETLCPDGVEYVSMKDIKEESFWLMPATPNYISDGIPYITSKNVKNGVIDFTNVKYISQDDFDIISANRKIEKNDLLITMIGTIGEAAFVNEQRDFYGQNMYLIRLDEKKVDRYYFYYFVTSLKIKSSLLSKKNASSQGYIKAGSLENLLLPLPPLKIQREIVRVLDNFTELTSELTSELTARKKQYEYYRDDLLAFDGKNVEWKRLEDISTDMYRGAGIKRDQVTEEGIPCVRYGEIYTAYDISFKECKSHTNEKEIHSKKYFEYGDILFTITGESVEEIAKSIAYLGDDKCLAGGDIVVLKHNQNPRYLSYALSTTNAQMQKSKGKVKSKVVHSSVPALKEILVPIPSLEEQERIANILDNFHDLCNDISEGIPAEIEARQKQYEYYRDKLLTFKELGA